VRRFVRRFVRWFVLAVLRCGIVPVGGEPL
jgi:hypothetical protein